ncbi:MAG: CHAD domain-containing protein [Coriobacteriia bacterium]|nr:CHAD domain-containing protein [Coriobacteriia bacterium]
MDKRFVVKGVDAHTPLAEAAPALLRSKAKPLFDLEAAARGGADMDAVHDMRVASRRLREAMRLLEPLYPRKEFRAWYRNVRAITRALGPVRDSDVFIDAFSRLGTQLGEAGRRYVAFAVGYRMGQREHELGVLNAVLGKLDLEESRRSFKALVDSPSDSAVADRTLAEFAHAEVAVRAATVFEAQPPALDEDNIASQHALRIDYKRLRYAVEAFAPCYGDAFDDVHAVLTAFQDTLGDLHDLHVFLDMVRLPERTEAAVRAGVSAEGISHVASLLEAHAHETFTDFAKLAAEHDPERLLAALLLPLSQTQGETHSVQPPEVADVRFVVGYVEETSGDPVAPDARETRGHRPRPERE